MAYNPAIGRWMQRDPLGLGPDINDYRTEGNDPTDELDPSGMIDLEEIKRYAIDKAIDKAIDEALKALRLPDQVKIYIEYNKKIMKIGSEGFTKEVKQKITEEVDIQINLEGKIKGESRPARGWIVMKGNIISTSSLVDKDALEGFQKKLKETLEGAGFTDITFDYKARIHYGILFPTTKPRPGTVEVLIALFAVVNATGPKGGSVQFTAFAGSGTYTYNFEGYQNAELYLPPETPSPSPKDLAK